MPKVLHYSEKVGCGVTIRLDSGEPCLLSVAKSGVLVKKSRFGILGATLYNEKNVYSAAKDGMALASLYPTRQIPLDITNPVLGAFAEAIWHCASAAEVARVLKEAIQNAAVS